MAQGVAARRAQHDGIAAPHAGRRYGRGHGIASRHGGHRGGGAGHHAAAVVMMVVQVFGLSAGVGRGADAVHVAVGRHGEMHLFHGSPFGLGWLCGAAVPDFNVVEQGLEPLERSRGGRHLRDIRIFEYGTGTAIDCRAQNGNDNKHKTTTATIVHRRRPNTCECTGYANTIEGPRGLPNARWQNNVTRSAAAAAARQWPHQTTTILGSVARARVCPTHRARIVVTHFYDDVATNRQ